MNDDTELNIVINRSPNCMDVIVYQDDNENRIESLPGFIENLQSKLAVIPEEFRGAAKIQIKGRGGYDYSGYWSTEIYYTRPETEADIQDRKKRKEQDKVDRINDTLQNLEDLKESCGADIFDKVFKEHNA